MSALARTSESDCRTRTTGENCTARESWTRTKYSYDSLFRLASAVTNGSANYPKWGLSMTYDRYGNRTAQSVSSGCVSPMLCPTNSVTVSTATNRITGSPYAYDANGNTTNDGNNTLVYDAENRLLSATNGSASGTYTYDGNNLRAKKVSGSTTTVFIFSGSNVLAEYDNGASPSSPSREYIYSGSSLLAKIDSSGTKYYHQDHISNRLVTDSNGNTFEQLGHYPFGESWYNVSNDKLLFTSYQRDSESGNDYAMMRFGVNRLARFASPDRFAGSARNPQSLNHYTYTQNDPINLSDPSGLTPRMYACGGGFDVFHINGCVPWGSDGGGGGGGCTLDGIVTPCGAVQSLIGAGGADQCPANICEFISNGAFYRFSGSADGSSGYIRSDAPPGWSFGDFSNASLVVSAAANGTAVEPGQLTGRAAAAYKLLMALGVSPENITIYQNGTQSFAAILTDEGFNQLEDADVDSNVGDAFLHYPYSDGGRDNNTRDSLHFVWFDENLTDSTGGTGVYMQFHLDSSNPWAGGFWQHWGCDVFHITCH